jgi:hypothetical protein
MSVLIGAAYSAQYVASVSSLAGATVALTVTAPDGTTSTPAVAVNGVTATATVPATKAGAYLLVWSVTGAVTDAQQDQFTAVAASLGLLSITDLRDQLNISPDDNTSTARLRRFLQSAADVVQNITGPILPLPITRQFDGENSFIVLPERWVKSVTEMHETRGITNYTLTEQPLGQSVDAFGYTWDRQTNKIIRRAYGGAVALFPPGLGVVSISYTAGMDTIPQDVSDATGELIRHWWSHGQQPFRGTFQATTGDDDGGTITVMGYAVPNRVNEMLAPYRRRVGIF